MKITAKTQRILALAEISLACVGLVLWIVSSLLTGSWVKTLGYLVGGFVLICVGLATLTIWQPSGRR
jgi:hypothetical protein